MRPTSILYDSVWIVKQKCEKQENMEKAGKLPSDKK